MDKFWHLPSGQSLCVAAIENIIQITIVYKDKTTTRVDYHYLTTEIDQTGELRLVLKVRENVDATD